MSKGNECLSVIIILTRLLYLILLSESSLCGNIDKLLTYLLTPWSRVLLEKLTGSAASQEIPSIFGTRRFLTVLTSARHLSLFWSNSIQSPQPPPTSWRSTLILSSHLRLGLPSGLFPWGFPTRILCTPLPSPIRANIHIALFFSVALWLCVDFCLFVCFFEKLIPEHNLCIRLVTKLQRNYPK